MKKTAAAEKKLEVENDRQMRHVLQLSCGLSVELLLDVKARRAIGVWSERPTWELMSTVLREYPRWRDEILKSWTSRRGKTSMSIPVPKVVIDSRCTRGRNRPRNKWCAVAPEADNLTNDSGFPIFAGSAFSCVLENSNQEA